MDLAKPEIDIGLFSNRLEEAQAFYSQKVGLEFESIMNVSATIKQHRYLANGSVVKIMHTTEPLRSRQPGGYDRITIPTSKVSAPQTLHDQDGNAVELVPPGHNGVTQMEIHIGVSDVEAFERFYRDAMGAERIGPGRCKLGQTIFSFSKDPAVKPLASPAPLAGPADVVTAMAGIGFRYITARVRSCEAAFKQATSGGAAEGVKPSSFGKILTIAFIRDPDGNFFELAERHAE